MNPLCLFSSRHPLDLPYRPENLAYRISCQDYFGSEVCVAVSRLCLGSVAILGPVEAREEVSLDCPASSGSVHAVVVCRYSGVALTPAVLGLGRKEDRLASDRGGMGSCRSVATPLDSELLF